MFLRRGSIFQKVKRATTKLNKTFETKKSTKYVRQLSNIHEKAFRKSMGISVNCFLINID